MENWQHIPSGCMLVVNFRCLRSLPCDRVWCDCDSPALYKHEHFTFVFSSGNQMTLQYNVVFGNRNSKSWHSQANSLQIPCPFWSNMMKSTLKALFWYQCCVVRSSTVGVVPLPNLSNLASKCWTWNTSSASISWQWILRWHGGVDAASVYNQVED